ncbi:MAG: HAMP domain-containing protein, partial [Lachnospiraceae bacterium]|nr:HAMP domain-containing protein [Lachnospiraceae bacterium]
MKNLKINAKFIVSFGLILVLFLVSVIATCSGIAISKSGYEKFYEEEFVAVTTVQDIKTKLQEALKEMLIIVETTDEQEYTQRSQIINQNISDIRTSVETLCETYHGDTTLLEQFLQLMTDNGSVREHVMEQAALRTEEGNRAAMDIVLNEYIPVVEEYTAVLNQAYTEIGTTCQTNFEEQMLLLNGLLAAGIVIAAVAFVITIILALRLSVSVTVPVRIIEAAMKEMVKGNLSVAVDYNTGDEFGSMAESMSKVTTEVSAIVGDIERVLGAMADGDFTVHSRAVEAYVGDYQKIFHSMKKIKDTFNETLATLNRSATQVSSGSDQVSSGAQALSQGATEQASSVEELAASINEISNNINQSAQNAQEASNKSMQVGEKAGESNDRMRDMLQAMADINSSSGEIGKIIKTIED